MIIARSSHFYFLNYPFLTCLHFRRSEMCATKFVDAPLNYIDYGNKATVPEAIINTLSATFHFLGYSRAYNLAPDEELGAMSISVLVLKVDLLDKTVMLH